jgi:hypothetical protein
MATITAEQINQITEHMLRYEEYDTPKWRTDYSGRGMYGDECVGVVVDNASGFNAAMVMAVCDWLEQDKPEETEEELAEDNIIHTLTDRWEIYDMFGHPSQDNMGRSAIVYWPDLRFVGDADDINNLEDD